MLLRRIIPQSSVDGPGNRMAIFLQGCNLRCAYCHNPETWDVSPSPDDSPDAVRDVTVEEVVEEVARAVPFIRGITVSGGECMLQVEALTDLFRKVKQLGLSCLIDSNGSVDFSLYPDLLALCDGVMLDVKAWDNDVFRNLTGGENAVVKRNLRLLADERKLEEVRIVCLENEVDVENCIRGVAAVLREKTATTRLRLIRFRNNGVIGRLAEAALPTDEQMNKWHELARRCGFCDIVTT